MIPKFEIYFKLDNILNFDKIIDDFDTVFDLAVCSIDYDN